MSASHSIEQPIGRMRFDADLGIESERRSNGDLILRVRSRKALVAIATEANALIEDWDNAYGDGS